MYFDFLKSVIRLAFRIPCIFHAITGLYCPGCGGTRAVKYLLQGQILTSIQYHPLVLYMVLVVTAEGLTWLAARLTGKSELYLRHGNFFIWFGVAMAAVNCLLKNVLLVGFGIDLLLIPLV